VALVGIVCLKVKEVQGETEWIYESDEIIGYLEDRVVGALSVGAV
jgi:hypothetical protein